LIGSAAKRTAERLLVASGAADRYRARFQGRRLILAYHNISPDDALPVGDRSLHLPRKKFAEQLDILKQMCVVVPLQELLEEGDQGSAGPRVAITFDDAYRGAVTAGVEELTRRSMPATIFVVPTQLNDAEFWWDSVSDMDGAGLSPTLRDRLLSDECGKRSAILERMSPEVDSRPEMPPESRAASEQELTMAVQHQGISLGSHTWSHPNLTRISSEELTEELATSLQWLRNRFDHVMPWLSYPYGISTPAVERAAEAAGYAAALRVEGGWIGQEAIDRFSLPRLNIPAGLSGDGFRLRISGLW